MTLAVRSFDVVTSRSIRIPGGLRADDVDVPRGVTDGHRHRSIPSLQALGLAVAGSVVTIALQWLTL